MSAEQLPVLKPKPPALPQPCVVCGATVTEEQGHAHVKPPVVENEGYWCQSCTTEARIHLMLTRGITGPARARAPKPAAET